MEDNRIAVIGITVNHREENSIKVQEILAEFGNIIIGRMGLPYKDRGISIISLIVDGTNDEIGALSGKLGSIDEVKTKVSMMK